MNLTLPTDSNERKEIPITSGCLAYFPAALAGVARVSKAGNDKHNKGEPLHHARGKSMDHADCIVRHLMDVQDLLAVYDRNTEDLIEGLDVRALGKETAVAILAEASQLCWRALALSQELHERFGAPLAPGARLPEQTPSPYAGKIAENVCLSSQPPLKPGFPITPGVYRARNGTQFAISVVDDIGAHPIRSETTGRSWHLNGSYSLVGETGLDLVERLADATCLPLSKPGFPVTPGVYRSRKGQLWTVARIRPPGADARPYDYPAREANECMCWTIEGRYWFSEHDLLERVSDLPPQARIPEPYDGYKADFQK